MIYDLPAPNEGVSRLGELKFGKMDYDWLYHPKSPEAAHYYHQNERGFTVLRKDWRLLLPSPDPWALRVITIDPDYLWSLPNVGGAYRAEYELWDADLFQDMMILYRPFIVEIRTIQDRNFSDRAFMGLYSAVLAYFRTTYREAYFPRWQEDRLKFMEIYAQRYTMPTWSQHWDRACKVFEEAALLVAQFLVRHYGLYPEHWAPILVEAVDLSALLGKTTDPQFQGRMQFKNAPPDQQ